MAICVKNVPTRYFATPLWPLQDHEKGEELQVNDQVLLCRHYQLLVERTNEAFVPSPSDWHGPIDALGWRGWK